MTLRTFTPNRPDANGWIRLREGNDWGHDYVSREPYETEPIQFREYKDGQEGPLQDGFDQRASARRAYGFDDGELIRVRLPNGIEREGRISYRHVTGRVIDMGNSYEVAFQFPFVDFGDGTRAELRDIEIKYEPGRDPTARELEAHHAKKEE
jgi:hypothetical protein